MITFKREAYGKIIEHIIMDNDISLSDLTEAFCDFLSGCGYFFRDEDIKEAIE